MKANLKSIIAVGALALSFLSGCASLNVEGDGNGASDRPEILSQLENDSRGK